MSSCTAKRRLCSQADWRASVWKTAGESGGIGNRIRKHRIRFNSTPMKTVARWIAVLCLLVTAVYGWYRVGPQWMAVIFTAATGALICRLFAAHRLSYSMTGALSIVGGAVGSAIIEVASFSLLDVRTPPHLLFVLAGIAIGMAVHVALGPPSTKVEDEMADKISRGASAVWVVAIGVLMGPFVCLVGGGGHWVLLVSPIVGLLAGLIVASPFALKGLR